jgi:hypothetical protein
MPIGYYLAGLETQRYIWIGTLGDTTSAAVADAELVSSFCLLHRGKALVVVSETHQVLVEDQEWQCNLRNTQIEQTSCL